MLLGDFNARVGLRLSEELTEDEWSDVRGPWGNGECNEAGQELLSFLSMNNATICNTWFKTQYKQSWQHPLTKEWHSIDFIIVHQRHRRDCQDCRVVWAADCGSDHHIHSFIHQYLFREDYPLA